MDQASQEGQFMPFIRKLVITMVTLIAVGGGLAAAAAPAHAATIGKVCAAQSSPRLCLYANGTSGRFVYAKARGTGRRADFAVSTPRAYVCGGTDRVDGNGTLCPFPVGSGLNKKYSGDTIFYMERAGRPHLHFLSKLGTDVTQGSNKALWVAAPAS